MRALRERGMVEREALARRLQQSAEGVPEKLPRLRRITSSVSDTTPPAVDGTSTH